MPSPLSSVQTVLQEVLFNPLRFESRDSRPINPRIVLVMHLMFVEKLSLRIISNSNVPRLGMAAFQLDEFKYVHDNDFRGFGHIPP
jgi:hypothetical protein